MNTEEKLFKALVFAVQEGRPVMLLTKSPEAAVALLKEIAERSGDLVFDVPMGLRTLDEVAALHPPFAHHSTTVLFLAAGLASATPASQAYVLGLMTNPTPGWVVVGVDDPSDRGTGMVSLLADRMMHVEV